MTFVRYVSSQPAINRLFFIPTFAVVSFFNKFSAILLNTVILAAALPSFAPQSTAQNTINANHRKIQDIDEYSPLLIPKSSNKSAMR